MLHFGIETARCLAACGLVIAVRREQAVDAEEVHAFPMVAAEGERAGMPWHNNASPGQRRRRAPARRLRRDADPLCPLGGRLVQVLSR
jgi:hypothetical protein